jgi:hypothetical protein
VPVIAPAASVYHEPNVVLAAGRLQQPLSGPPGLEALIAALRHSRSRDLATQG